MLMAWGPFRFSVPTFSVETLRRSVQPRLQPQPVIRATPPIHRLGPGNETITLESTFFPQHLNGRGLAQLAGIRQAANAMTPLQLVHINGAGMNIFGLWLLASIDSEETIIDARGSAQMVTASLSMIQDGGQPGMAAAISAVAGGAGIGVSAGFGPFSVNAAVGLGGVSVRI